MGHQDDHPNASAGSGEGMPFPQKASRLLDHWIHHNDEHAQNYKNWAAEFRKHDMPAVAVLLESAAELTSQINLTLQQAAQQIPSDD